MAIMYLMTLIGIASVQNKVSSAYTAADATTLQHDLLSNYSSKVRPSATTIVDVKFGMMHITELNIVNQQLHTVGFLIVRWTDNRLIWTPSDYGDMEETYMLLSDIWSPPMLLNNAADEIKIINDNSHLTSMNVYLGSNGFVVWLAPASFVAHCTVNVMHYPFDSQKCNFMLSSWLLVKDHLEVVGAMPSINMDIYKENGEWEITRSTVKNVTRIMSGHDFPAVKFTVYLSRKYSYYLMNMILPVVVLAIMAPFVFMLPVGSGEKIGFALTILLSLSVIMTLVSESIPPTSTHICILSVYLLTTFIICSIETLLTVITCRIHDYHLKGSKMKQSLQSKTRILARITKYTKRSEQQGLQNAPEKHVSSTMNDTKMKGHTVSLEKITKSECSDCKNAYKVEDVEEYSLEDFVTVFDKFNFFAFTIITVSVTLIFILILRVGEKS